jgi:hypothetical protein
MGDNVLGIGFSDHLCTPLGSALYRSLTHTDLCPQSITYSSSRFLATDFNTETITVSLNYTLQISHIKFSFHSRTLAINSFLHSLSYRTPLNCQLSTKCVPGWRPFHTNLLVFSSQADSNWTDNWTLSLTNQLLHWTELNWTELNCWQL